MKKTIKVKMQLKRPAKKKGGDRYEAEYKGETLTLYFPQTISRAVDGKTPANQLMLTVEY